MYVPGKRILGRFQERGSKVAESESLYLSNTDHNACGWFCSTHCVGLRITNIRNTISLLAL